MPSSFDEFSVEPYVKKHCQVCQYFDLHGPDKKGACIQVNDGSIAKIVNSTDTCSDHQPAIISSEWKTE